MSYSKLSLYCAENKLRFFLVFQIINTLKVNRLVNYYEKQNRNLFSCCSLPLFLFFALFIRLNAQADAFFQFDFDFSSHDYSECAAILIDGDVLVNEYSPDGKCKLNQDDEGMLSLSTVSLTDIATIPRDAIKFQVAIKNKKTNTLFLLTKEAVLEIDLKDILEQCKLGDSIIILTDNQRYSLTHHEIEIMWKC